MRDNFGLTKNGNTLPFDRKVIKQFSFLIAVKVIPRSYKHENGPNCNNKKAMDLPYGDLPNNQNLEITYTYSVTFSVSKMFLNYAVIEEKKVNK